MDKYTVVGIGIAAALALLAWLDHKEAKTSTVRKRTNSVPASDSNEDPPCIARMGACYIGIFSDED